MPARRITTVDRGGGLFDLVMFDENDNEVAIAVGNFGSALQIGPAWWEDVAAAGILGLPFSASYGVPASILFDSDALNAMEQSTLAATLVAHDPLQAATPNMRLSDLLLLDQQANDILNGMGNLTQEAKVFATDFLAWSADSPER